MIVSSLVGQTVNIISFDYAVLLTMLDESYVRLEQPFTVEFDNENKKIEITPEALGDESSVALRLLREEIIAAHVTTSGALSISFSNGALLFCAPHPKYEAWEVHLATGETVLSTPGGETANWGTSPNEGLGRA